MLARRLVCSSECPVLLCLPTPGLPLSAKHPWNRIPAPSMFSRILDVFPDILPPFRVKVRAYLYRITWAAEPSFGAPTTAICSSIYVDHARQIPSRYSLLPAHRHCITNYLFPLLVPIDYPAHGSYLVLPIRIRNAHSYTECSFVYGMPIRIRNAHSYAECPFVYRTTATDRKKDQKRKERTGLRMDL